MDPKDDGPARGVIVTLHASLLTPEVSGIATPVRLFCLVNNKKIKHRRPSRLIITTCLPSPSPDQDTHLSRAFLWLFHNPQVVLTLLFFVVQAGQIEHNILKDSEDREWSSGTWWFTTDYTCIYIVYASILYHIYRSIQPRSGYLLRRWWAIAIFTHLSQQKIEMHWITVPSSKKRKPCTIFYPSKS